MGKVVLITLSDYRAIMQLEDDGANTADITYKIVPDLLDSDNETPKSDESGSFEG